jgi:hypothetical protein
MSRSGTVNTFLLRNSNENLKSIITIHFPIEPIPLYFVALIFRTKKAPMLVYDILSFMNAIVEFGC